MISSLRSHFIFILGIYHAPYNASNPVPCVTCKGLKICNIINQLMIQEKYYPNNLQYLESCTVLESLGVFPSFCSDLCIDLFEWLWLQVIEFMGRYLGMDDHSAIQTSVEVSLC